MKRDKYRFLLCSFNKYMSIIEERAAFTEKTVQYLHQQINKECSQFVDPEVKQYIHDQIFRHISYADKYVKAREVINQIIKNTHDLVVTLLSQSKFGYDTLERDIILQQVFDKYHKPYKC